MDVFTMMLTINALQGKYLLQLNVCTFICSLISVADS